MKILIVGNSHSGDTFWLLKEVFSDQYDGDVVLGYLYYSGCSINQHVSFAENNEYVYDYNYNADGEWFKYKDASLEMALQDQNWDYVVLQPTKSDMTEDMNLAKRRTLEAIIHKNVPQPYNLIWHVTWANPDEDKFFEPDWPYQKAPAGYKANLIQKYGFNADVQFEQCITSNVKSILPDDTYDKKICTGSAVMYSLWNLGLPLDNIYRDYTHLNDYGRLMAAYSFYAQFMGEKITEVGIDVVPVRLRNNLFQMFGDLQITEEMKQVIIESVNNSVDHPWEVIHKPAAG